MAAGPELIVILAGNVVRTLPLSPGVVSLGRLPDNTVSLEAPAVSRRHAELRVLPPEEGGAVLTDLGSSNGTFMSGDRLVPDRPVPLQDGATWEIGPFTLVFRAAREGGGGTLIDLPEQSAPAPPPATPAPGIEEPAAPDVLPVPPSPRTRLPAPLPREPASRYLRDLPVIFHDNDFLGRYLLLFEAVWEPLEDRQDHLEMYFDPHTCPPEFLRWLAGWLGLSFNDHWPEARRRRLLAEAMDLYRWRGTRYGLVRMLEVCTGLTSEVTDDPDTPFVFRVRMHLPPESGVDRELIEDLVRAHKPAHAGYVLEVGPSGS